MRAVASTRTPSSSPALFWQLNAVALRAGDEAMLIDSPYFPEELELLPAVLAQSGFTPAALLATHADFDHLLGRAAFPDLSLGVAESTMLRIRAEPGAAQRELRDHDDRDYVERPRPLSLGSDPVAAGPGAPRARRPGAGAARHRRPHRRRHGGLRALAGRAGGGRLPVAGRDPDDLAGRLGGRLPLARWRRWRPWSSGRRSVVPGHGAVLDRDAALRVLEEDVAYLDALDAAAARPRFGRTTAHPRSEPAGRSWVTHHSVTQHCVTLLPCISRWPPRTPSDTARWRWTTRSPTARTSWPS